MRFLLSGYMNPRAHRREMRRTRDAVKGKLCRYFYLLMIFVYPPFQRGPSQVLEDLTNNIHPLPNQPEIKPVYGFNRQHGIDDRFVKHT